ncbi:MAG: EAL domain-containing protein [Zoogloeaceae bacterium]|nr:EAL domain-containing protein [Zoogloeaceae bacterium]
MSRGYLWCSFTTAILLGIVMWVWVVVDLSATRQRDLDTAVQKGAIITQILEWHMLAITQKMDARLSEFVFRFQRDIAAGRNREGIQASLNRNQILYPEVRGFQVTDTQGTPIFADGSLAIPIDPDSADFFQKLRDDPEAGMVISQPLLSRVTDEWLILYGRRLEDAQGRFIGVAALAVRSRFFEASALSLQLARGETIALAGPGQKLVLHLPRLPEDMATPLGKTAFVTALAADALEGSFFQKDAWDGTKRLFYFQNTQDSGMPFIIMFGQEERQILLGWRQRLAIYVVLCSAVSLILALLIRSWYLTYRRVEHQAEYLSRQVEDKDREWRALLDSFPDPAWLVDLEGRYLAVNETFCTRLELKREEVIGYTVAQLFSEEEVRALAQGWQATLEKKRPTAQVVWFNLQGKGRVPVEIRRVPVFDEKGAVRALAGVARNLSADYETKSRQYLLAQLFENNHEGLLIINGEEKITVANRAFAEAIGYDQEEILGRYPGHFRAPRHDPAFIDEISRLLRTQGRWNGEIWLQHKNGREIPMECRILPLVDQMEQRCWIVFMSNLTERKLSESHIDALANVDTLTGLPNRGSFMHMLARRLESGGAVGAALTLDLNQLSRVNDAYGHLAGDYLLRRVGKRMRRLLRGQDVLGRLGDDQFGILLDEVDARSVEIVIRKILNMVARPIVVEGETVTCTASIGVCLIPADGQDAKTILRNADAAMHDARTLGPGNYRFFSPEMNTRLTDRLRRENDLRNAARRGELRLYYQPQVNITQNRIIGCEALLRWVHPEKGLVPPLNFIPLAEETGLILPIGKWVLEEACRQNKAWQEAGLPPITVAVNLSAIQFQDQELTNNVVRALERSGLEARWLELEITESVLMQEPEQVVRTLENLKALGVRLSIDDFGTGYSSLAYLKRFPIDKIKIDRSFIQDLGANNDDAVIVRMVLGMVRELRLQAIAEGVEDQEQLAFLMSCQCPEYQGYLCSKPLPSEEFRALLEQAQGHPPRH